MQNHSASDFCLQQELESIWNDLQMPNSLKLDMALKYSSDSFLLLLPNVSCCFLQKCQLQYSITTHNKLWCEAQQTPPPAATYRMILTC